MGKKSMPKEKATPKTEVVRQKLSKSEKRKLYIAGLLSITMLVLGYLVIKNIFVTSYDPELGGLWQVEKIVLEKTEGEGQSQVALQLVTDEMEEGPQADYRILAQDEPVKTDEGEQRLPELGSFKVELIVDDLTLYPVVESSLKQGMIEIAVEEGNPGILKRMQAFTLEDGKLALYFGFDEEPQVSWFESTQEAVRIQFAPQN